MKLPRLGAVLTASSLAASAWAQTAPVTELDPYVTTATRTPAGALKAAKSASKV